MTARERVTFTPASWDVYRDNQHVGQIFAPVLGAKFRAYRSGSEHLGELYDSFDEALEHVTQAEVPAS